MRGWDGRQAVGALVLATALAATACSRPGGAGLEVGGIYSIEVAKGQYSAAKVLALPEDLPEAMREEDIVLVRMYLEWFDHRPSMEELEEAGPAGAGGAALEMLAAPTRIRDLESADPELVEVESLTSNEQEGVRMWTEIGRVPAGVKKPW